MEDRPVRLGPREKQIVELLLQGCDNTEIARQLKMARRTVKAHFNRLFMRFGITGGIKRVKLATILFRRQQWSERNISESVRPTSESSESLSSSLKASKTAKLRTRSAQPSTSLKTTYAPFTTNSDSGTESNSHSGTKQGVRKSPHNGEHLESWEYSILDLDPALITEKHP
jgi:Bacterial regulatory proteins, luxR family